MIPGRAINLKLLYSLLFLLPGVFGSMRLLAQQTTNNITITPNPQPIILQLDATGHYTVQLSDVATVKGLNITQITIDPPVLDNTMLGDQNIAVRAFTNYNPLDASFDAPYGMAIDNQGNIFVIDQGSNKIREIATDGQTSTIAGDGKRGYIDGPAASAEFDGATGIAVDNSGNVYVSDEGDIHIRKITPDHMVSTIAGDGTTGDRDGAALSANFRDPVSLCVDNTGNIFICDAGSIKIRKLDIHGVVTTVGSAIPAVAVADPSFVTSIAVDNADNIYIQQSNYIAEMHPDGSVIDLAGSPTGSIDVDGSGIAAQFRNPCNFARDAAGNLFVMEQSQTIRKVTPGGDVTTFLKRMVDPLNCHNIVVDAYGNLYESDPINNVINKIDPNGNITVYAGNGQAKSANNPDNFVQLLIPVKVIANANSGGSQSITIATPSQSVCSGQPVTFTATTNNIGPCSYDWQIGSQTPQGVNSPTFTYSDLLNGDTVYCIASTTGTVPQQHYISNMIVMKVNPLITPSITLTPEGVQTCQGLPLTFTVDTLGGGLNPTFLWRVNGKQVGTNSTVYKANNFNDGDTVVCLMYNNSQCTTGNPGVSNLVIVKVDPNTATYVNISSSAKGAVCKGQAITFTATPITNDANPIIQWYVNGNAVGTNSTTYSSGNFNDGDVVTCTSTSLATGCYTNNVAKSDTIRVQVLHNSPTVSIIQNTLGACEGTPVMFTADTANVGAEPSYQWQVNGVNAGDNAIVFTGSNLKNGDKVDCILSTGATCSAPITSNTLSAVLKLSPSVSFKNPVIALNLGSSVALSPQVSGDISAYRWSPATGLSDATIQNPVATPQIPTTYTLQVMGADSCMASASVKVNVLITLMVPNTFTPNGDGVNDTWVINGLEYYPGCTVEVYGRYGSLVYKSVGYATPWDGKLKGKLLPAGTYYYIIDPKNGRPKQSGSVTIIK